MVKRATSSPRLERTFQGPEEDDLENMNEKTTTPQTKPKKRYVSVKQIFQLTLLIGIVLLFLTWLSPESGSVIPNTKEKFVSLSSEHSELPKHFNLTDLVSLLCSRRPLKFEIFEANLHLYLTERLEDLKDQRQWHSDGNAQDRESFFSVKKNKGRAFLPFVERKVFPPKSRVAIWGDLHGSDCSLARTLIHFKDELKCIKDNFVLEPDCYMAFLGDFGDRGPNGMEVYFILMLLKRMNPSQVFLVRGNHEDARLIEFYGFIRELELKTNLGEEHKQLLYRFYDTLPSAFYLGSQVGKHTEWLQFSHGSFEMGYSPRTFLDPSISSTIRFQEILSLSRLDYFNQTLKGDKDPLSDSLPREVQDIDDITSGNLGLLWHDFLGEGDEVMQVIQGRGIAYGPEILVRLLALASGDRWTLRGIFRAHQHHNLAGYLLRELIEQKGIAHMGTFWPSVTSENIFLTFLSAPQSNLGFLSDSYGVLYPEGSFEEWRLEHYYKNHQMPNSRFFMKLIW